MQRSRLVRRGLLYYWRTHAAVVAGVAAAVTVLAGALIVGDSVRGSLRDLVLQRLGRADLVLLSSDFFRVRLADDLLADPSFGADFQGICPIVSLPGVATDQATGRRASRVQVYGVDDRFWRFHGVHAPLNFAERDALLSPALARELATERGGTVLIRVQRPTDIPIESLHGRKEDVGRTLRVTVAAVLDPGNLGEFSLQPQQGDVRALFVPLSQLQQDLETGTRVNALLLSARPGARDTGPRLEAMVRRHATLEDVGLTVRVLEPQRVLVLEGDGGLLDDPRAAAGMSAARELGLQPSPVFTYLATSIRRGDREVPYSLVTATDLAEIAPGLERRPSANPPLVLNDWAARELAATVGDPVTLEYYVWEDPGRLVTRTATFEVAAVAPLRGAAADRDLAPAYPGITESDSLRDWDPPFPIDLRRIRPADEEYWRAYRTTPKAFLPLEVGQTLWRSRYGALTSIRMDLPPDAPPAEAREHYASLLRGTVDPIALGLAVRNVRADGLAASRGATDFGEYFAYFSAFLVVSALMLAALFFKLGVEQRGREIGLLRAVGFTTALVRWLFVAEAMLLTGIGSALGILGAVGYGALMMAGLRTWWVDAVGTTALTLHVSTWSLAGGTAGVVLAALGCIWWTLRTLARVSERSLLAGQLAGDSLPSGPVRGQPRGSLLSAAAFLLLSVLLLAGAASGSIDSAGAFFGAGASLLGSCLSALMFWLRRPPRTALGGHGWWPVVRLGLRSATYRPARSVLSVAVMASATFILISVDAFRRDPQAAAGDRASGTGGYSLLVESLLPLAYDPNSQEGREQLGLSALDGITIVPFRLLPGDDASCLNLYEPRQPRVLGAPPDFVAQGRFAFQGTLDGAERDNPWRLLEREQPDGAIPVIADATSMTYVLHRTLGDEITIDRGGAPLRLRFVAALADSVFQSELLMSEANFLKLFPEEEGYRFLLMDAPPDRIEAAATAVEDRLADFGADAVPTVERLAAFHKVENTYLSTFQTLGGLGLLLGTIGLAAVLLRNVLERRRELALLEAVGYRRAHLFLIVAAESALLLACGLVIGTTSALIAVAPAAAEHGGRLPTGAGAWLMLFAVFGTGLVATIVAARAAVQARLLDALRAE